jgi:cupin 2 domain-containing protein
MAGSVAGPPTGGNLLRIAAPPSGPEELLELLAAGAGYRIERIVSAGQVTATGEWYDQPWDEWVALLQGRATLRYEDGRVVGLGPGDWLWIPAAVRHRVEETSAEPPCVWLAIHLEPRVP